MIIHLCLWIIPALFIAVLVIIGVLLDQCVDYVSQSFSLVDHPLRTLEITVRIVPDRSGQECCQTYLKYFVFNFVLVIAGVLKMIDLCLLSFSAPFVFVLTRIGHLIRRFVGHVRQSLAAL